MTKFATGFLALFCASWLNGGSAAVASNEDDLQVFTIQRCVDITAYSQQISDADAEWRRLQSDALYGQRNGCETLRLGLLMSHPDVAFQHDAQALELLGEALLRLPVYATDKDELALLVEHIKERQALRNKLGGSLRRQRAQAQEIATLRSQINQLRSLEKSLDEKTQTQLEDDAPSDSQ